MGERLSGRNGNLFIMGKNIYSTYEGWERLLRKPSILFDDWCNKEEIYLQKNIKKNSIVLDVGCGFGKDVRVIANIAKEINGIDCYPEAIKTARKNLSKFKNIKLFQEDAKRLHFKDNNFDYTICMGNTFGNFGDDKIKVLKEMKRVTKKNGKIIISVYSEKALPVRIENYTTAGLKIKKISKDGTVWIEKKIICEQFSKKKLKDIFKRVGLNYHITELNPISYVCKLTV